jgi:hypothetical protein
MVILRGVIIFQSSSLVGAMKNYIKLWQAVWGVTKISNATLDSKRHFLHKKLLGIMCNVIGTPNAVTVSVK